MIRRHVIVRGSVQGVFFRDACRRKAAAAGVSGWVANRDDGSVEAAFEGERSAVDAMVDWCLEGSAEARVDGVEVDDEQPRAESGFEVR